MSSHHAAGLKRNSHASTQPSPRRSNVDKTAKQRAANLRRTTVDRLAKTQQYRLRQLHHRIATRQHSPLRREGSVGVSPSNAAAQDDGSSARWKPAIKEVILGMRSTDAIIDRDQFKGRKYTYFHGIKMKKSSKARIGNAETTALEKKCRLCIDIVENATREAAQRMPPADEMENEMAPEVVHGTSSAEAENRMLADNTEAASADELGLVFSLFHSLPELDGLDSIYKKRLFFELRIRRFAAGSTVLKQGEKHTMVCVVLQGYAQLSSKHSGVIFQAGTCNTGEVVGSVTPSVGLFTARCTEATVLLCLDCDRLSAVLNDSASAGRIAKKNVLSHSLVFSTLNDEDLNTLETLFTTIMLEDNQVLCKEGSRADHVYVVKRGFLRVFKAFLPRGSQRPRPPPRASSKASSRAASRGSSRASSSPYTVKNGTNSVKDGGRLMHFDLGEIGPRDILGENGVLQQVERVSSTPATSAAASILPTVPLSSREPEDEDAKQHLDEPRASAADSRSSADDDAQADRDARLPSGVDAKAPATTAGAAASSAISVRQRKSAYLVSAAASGGKAEVYVAKAHELKRVVQTEGVRYSWKTAQRLHQAREQAWSAGALAQQLRREKEWAALRREAVLEALEIKH